MDIREAVSAHTVKEREFVLNAEEPDIGNNLEITINN
jgi:hypothetical protein